MLLACQFLLVAAHPFNKRQAPADAAAPAPPGSEALAPAPPGSEVPAPGEGVAVLIEGEGEAPVNGTAPAVDTDDRTFGLLPPFGMGMGGMGMGGMGGGYYNQMGYGMGGGYGMNGFGLMG